MNLKQPFLILNYVHEKDCQKDLGAQTFPCTGVPVRENSAFRSTDMSAYGRFGVQAFRRTSSFQSLVVAVPLSTYFPLLQWQITSMEHYIFSI